MGLLTDFYPLIYHKLIIFIFTKDVHEGREDWWIQV
jgi:hypothetical protein